MTPAFVFSALLTIAGAVLAMTLRNLVHCALALAVSFAGLAVIYLQLNAQFVGFAQVLIYIGAVAILILFAILLTRGTDPPARGIFSRAWPAGAVVAAAVFLLLSGAAVQSRFLRTSAVPIDPSVRDIGELLMTRYVLPLQVAGLLLTVALLGAVVVALKETRPAVDQPGGTNTEGPPK